MANPTNSTSATIPFSVASSSYKCFKQGLLIELPINFITTVVVSSVIGVFATCGAAPAATLAAASVMTYTSAFKLAASSAALYTISCTLGEVGQEYGGDIGLIFGRTGGNIMKYAANACLKKKLLNTDLNLSLEVIKGGINGALYGVNAALLNSNVTIAKDLCKTLGISCPALINDAMAIPIEMIDGLSDGPKGVATGFVVGSVVTVSSTWYDIGSNALDNVVSFCINVTGTIYDNVFGSTEYPATNSDL